MFSLDLRMRTLFFQILLITGACLWANAEATGQGTDTTQKGLPQNDTLRKTSSKKQPLGKAKYVHRKFDSSLFSENAAASRSDYQESLEKVFLLLNQVPEMTESFVRLDDIDDHLDLEDSALSILKDRLSQQSEKALNVRNLQMFNTLLDELKSSEGGYVKSLKTYDGKLDVMKKKITELRKDTLMLHIFRDTALKASFQPQLMDLRDKWRQADSLIRTYSTTVNNLQARSSANTITMQELERLVDTELKAVGNRAFGKERRYLWEPRTSSGVNYSREGFKKSVDSEQKLARFYFTNTRGNRLWLLLTGLVFFFWIGFNFHTLRKLNALNAVADFRFTYIRPWPIAATLIFILILAPLFDLHAPAIYIESLEFLLMLLLTIVFYRRLPRNLFYGWCGFLILFLLLPVTRILGMPLYWTRWANFIVDGLSITFGVFIVFIRPVLLSEQPKFVRVAAWLYIFLHSLALLCNLAGRVTLSQIFGATAVYSFTQTVSLCVFVQAMVEAFLLQVQGSRVRKKYPQQFDATIITRSVRRFTTALAIVLWLIVFTTNLNLFDSINDWLVELLTTSRQVGSIPFTLGGILLFLGIIWLANFLQRYITYFFGDVGDDAAFDDKGQRSKLMVTRLVLLILGFLLAVAASGLPVDRITVIIGALGVGIGLGLQSIVNNFVSGVILIFDRPLRIGDMVEIGDKKGRVKEIGIRSSTLLTEEGAEVIIPNGDVLSHNIVNWTLNNNYVRVNLALTIEKPANPALLQPDAVRDIVKTNPHVLDRKEPEVLVSPVNSKTLEVRVLFWCTDFNRTSLTSGEVRNALYQYLEKNGITVL
jgi:potassium-dependent mechanosensitive channel